MCYGCRISCDDCKPKFITCSKCGWRGYLMFDKCTKCGTLFTQKEKEFAVEQWRLKKELRSAAH